MVEADLMTDTVPFNLASSRVLEDWPVTWYPELVWWPWHPQSVKLDWPNLFKYHEGDLTCGSTVETILHHVGCIEPCKTDRQTNQQPAIWFAQNWTAVRNNPKRMDGLWSRIWGRQVSPLLREAWPSVVAIHAVIDHGGQATSNKFNFAFLVIDTAGYRITHMDQDSIPCLPISCAWA